MAGSALNAALNLSDVIGDFAAHADIQHALLLTYDFDGPFLEDAEHGLLEVLWQRNCENIMILRDGKAVLAEKRSHRYRVVNAAYSQRLFHSKLMLLVAESEVLAVVGSANLTRGGLAANLEIGHVYRLNRNEGPRGFFEMLADYLAQDLRLELTKASPQQQSAYDLLVRDLQRFLQGVQTQGASVEPRLLHNYQEPLLPQIMRNLPGQHIEALWVISPYFEADLTSDALAEATDDTLLETIFDGQTIVPIATDAPWVHLYTQSTPANMTTLPVNLLKKYQSQIALYLKNPAGPDQRTLHAKLLVFIGRTSTRRDAQPFVALIHGSANFTKAALLTKSPAGNAEIVVVTLLPRPMDVAQKLANYLNLPELFEQVHNWQNLQAPPLKNLPGKPVVQVWDCLVSLAGKTVTLFFEIKDARAQSVTVRLLGDQQREYDLGQGQAPFTPSLTFDLPDDLFEVVESDYRRLPYHSVRVEVLDADGTRLGADSGPINVDCPEAFCDDWWCQPIDLRLDNQIYLAGLGRRANYETLRKQLERLLQPGVSVSPALAATHQADLDLFFRRVHIGLRGLRWRVEHAPGSLYVLGDVLRQLARWFTQITGDGPVALDLVPYSLEQKLYLCDRLVQTADECIKQAVRTPRTDRRVTAVVREGFIEPAATAAQRLDDWRHDPILGVFADGIVKRWNMLVTSYAD